MSLTAIGIAVLMSAQCASQAETSGAAAASAEVATDDRRAIAQTLLEKYQANYERLGGFEVELQVAFDDRSVTEPRVIESKLAGGGVARGFVAPHWEYRVRFAGQGPAIRHETLDSSSGQTYCFDGLKWTELVPKRRLAAIRNLDQMPGLFWLDYRECVTLQLKWPLATILTTWEIEDHRVTANPDRTTIDFTAPGEQRLQLDFPAKYDQMPDWSVLWYPDGTVCQAVQLTYRQVPERDAWLVDRVVSRFFKQGATRDPTADSWTQRQTIDIQGLRLLSTEEATFELTVVVPTGYQIDDHTLRP